MKMTKKLTPAQIACLTLLSTKDRSDFYDLLRVGANGSTTTKLVDLQLITLSESKTSDKTWSITQAGRDTLACGRYTNINNC